MTVPRNHTLYRGDVTLGDLFHESFFPIPTRKVIQRRLKAFWKISAVSPERRSILSGEI